MISLDKGITFIFLIWVCLLIILPFSGNYLINDSYVYYWNVINSLESITLHPLTSPTIIFQTFLGSLVHKYFWAEPSTLRVMTFIMLLIATVTIYKIFLEIKPNKIYAFITSLLFMLNPLTLHLSLSFMSEMYFLTPLLLSILFYLKYTKINRLYYLFLISMFLAFSFLSRQIALIPILGFTYLIFKPKKPSTYLVFIPILIFTYYQIFYPKPAEYTNESILKTFYMLNNSEFYILVAERFIKTLFYLGFFFLPIATTYIIKEILVFINLIKNEDKIVKIYNLIKCIKPSIFFARYLFIATLLATFLYLKNKDLMFYIPNIISYAGFLPQSISVGIKQTWFVDSPVRIKILITALSTFSLAVLLHLVFFNFKYKLDKLKTNKNFATLTLCTLLMLSVSLVFRDFFDRYLIVLFPLIYIVFYHIVNYEFSDLKKKNNSVMMKFVQHLKTDTDIHQYDKTKTNNDALNNKILLILTIIFSFVWISFEYDYLKTQKVAWELTSKVDTNELDIKGPFEYNLFNRIDLITNVKNKTNVVPKDNEFKYLVSYEIINGYCEVARQEFTTPLGKNFKNTLFVIERCE